MNRKPPWCPFETYHMYGIDRGITLTGQLYTYFEVSFFCPYMDGKLYLSHLMTKPTKWPVCPAKTQISLGIRPVWSESSLCSQWVACPKVSSCEQRRLWSDWADAHADLSLRWVHSHFVSFVMRRLILWLSSMKRYVIIISVQPLFSRPDSLNMYFRLWHWGKFGLSF